MVFNLNVVAAWALQQAGWLYATGRGRLVEGMVPRLVRASRVLGFLTVADFTAAAATAWASPYAAQVIDLAAPVVYVTGATWLLLHRMTVQQTYSTPPQNSAPVAQPELSPTPSATFHDLLAGRRQGHGPRRTKY